LRHPEPVLAEGAGFRRPEPHRGPVLAGVVEPGMADGVTVDFDAAGEVSEIPRGDGGFLEASLRDLVEAVADSSGERALELLQIEAAPDDAPLVVHDLETQMEMRRHSIQLEGAGRDLEPVGFVEVVDE